MKKGFVYLAILISVLMPSNFGYSATKANICLGDVNGDCKVGIQEAIGILQTIAGVQNLIPADKIKALESIVSYGTLEMAKNVNNFSGVKQLADIAEYIGLANPQQIDVSSITDIISLLENYNFPCGSMSIENVTTAVFSFDNPTQCKGISGTVKITPSFSGGTLSYQVEYIDVQKDDCTINGNTNTTISTENANIIITLISDDLMVCDQPLDGNIIITYGLLGLVSIQIQAQNTYIINDTEINGHSNIIYKPSEGLNGSCQINLQGESYDVELNNLTIDPSCGVPTSGTIVINNIEMDFSNTDCENSVVTITVNGQSYTLSLEEVKNIYSGIQQGDTEALQDVINYTALVVAENNNIVPGIQQLSDVVEQTGLTKLMQQKRRMSVTDILTSLQNMEFLCGTMKLENLTTLVYTFNNPTSCNGITGKVKITPGLSDGLTFTVEFDNIQTNNCLINGVTTANINVENANIIITLVSDNLSICNQNFNDTLTLTYGLLGLVSVQIESQNSYVIDGTEINGQSDMTYDKTGGGLSGTTSLSFEDKNYEFSYNNMSSNPDCGIPTSGNLVINNIEIDFSNTTCTNPVVTCTIGEQTYTISLEEAKNIILSQLQPPQ
ncbi:conserved hypothetical protein, secreted [Candidatus Magnetomorum sp. HK-1]|nr:conserved hypothetical protein, secreted [Candidatus Magnetomorum sp. HK-1]